MESGFLIEGNFAAVLKNTRRGCFFDRVFDNAQKIVAFPLTLDRQSATTMKSR
jgi:hypothetical protein